MTTTDAIYSVRPGGSHREPRPYDGSRGRGRGSTRGTRGTRGDGFVSRGSRRGAPYGGQPNHRWEEARVEEGNVDEDVIELEANDEQLRIYHAKLDYVQRELRGRLDKDDVARICHDLDFDEEKIDLKIASYATDKKY